MGQIAIESSVVYAQLKSHYPMLLQRRHLYNRHFSVQSFLHQVTERGKQEQLEVCYGQFSPSFDKVDWIQLGLQCWSRSWGGGEEVNLSDCLSYSYRFSGCRSQRHGTRCMEGWEPPPAWLIFAIRIKLAMLGLTSWWNEIIVSLRAPCISTAYRRQIQDCFMKRLRMSKKIAVIIVKPQLQHLYMGEALFLCASQLWNAFWGGVSLAFTPQCLFCQILNVKIKCEIFELILLPQFILTVAKRQSIHLIIKTKACSSFHI